MSEQWDYSDDDDDATTPVAHAPKSESLAESLRKTKSSSGGSVLKQSLGASHNSLKEAVRRASSVAELNSSVSFPLDVPEDEGGFFFFFFSLFLLGYV